MSQDYNKSDDTLLSWVFLFILMVTILFIFAPTKAKAEVPEYVREDDPIYFIQAWKKESLACQRKAQETNQRLVFDLDEWKCTKLNPNELRDDWKEFR